MTSKKQGTSAVAHQPKDAVQGEETVWVPQNFINVTEFSSIDFGTGTNLSWAGGRHLIKPSELAVGLILKLSRLLKLSRKIDLIFESKNQ
jgi:hypothetical protein